MTAVFQRHFVESVLHIFNNFQKKITNTDESTDVQIETYQVYQRHLPIKDTKKILERALSNERFYVLPIANQYSLLRKLAVELSFDEQFSKNQSLNFSTMLISSLKAHLLKSENANKRFNLLIDLSNLCIDLNRLEDADKLLKSCDCIVASLAGAPRSGAPIHYKRQNQSIANMEAMLLGARRRLASMFNSF